ncbi:MAG TPA: alpha/beta fold hydrolase [Methylibium sp.]|nr:alpha/beta fold hydrolase [Methylibium sp.]
MSMRVLTLPGWHGSGPAHWQSRWERLHGHRRVEQHDWQQPRRGDWMARLDEVLQGDERPAVLVAHSLGCQLVAAWATHTRHAARVMAALLVAPPDTEQPDTPPQLAPWRPIALARLPFRATVVASTDDPYCSLARAGLMAQAWGANLVVAGAHGHLNAESGLGDWPQGLALLDELLPA